MTAPILRTERMRLVPLAERHLAHEIELDSDPEVMRYLTGRARDREEIEEAHRRRLAIGARNPGYGFWVGFLDPAPGDRPTAGREPDGRSSGDGEGDGEFVGWWILEPPVRPDQGPVEGQAELGYRLLPRYWRRGLGSEGARELMRYGFEDLGLARIFAETMAVNAASRATMAAVGMRHVRTFHQDWSDPLPGSELGEVEYAIARQEWFAAS